MFLKFAYLMLWVALWDKAWTEAMQARYVMFKGERQIAKAGRLAKQAQAKMKERDEVLALSTTNAISFYDRRKTAYNWIDKAKVVKDKHLS